MNRREILFRGKRVDNGEWVEGNLTINEAAKAHRIVVDFGLTGNMQGECNLCFGEFHLVDPSTIGQFTGLTDRNGVKIWEGDILIVPGGAWGIVVWKAPFFEVTISETESSLYSREWLQECEVFGNRFDNPELMQS